MGNWHNKRLPTLEGEEQITTVFEMVINKTYELGFQYCSFKMSSQSSDNQTDPIGFENYPPAWSHTYKQAHFFAVDPVVAHCKRSVFPILWDKKAFNDAPDLWDLAQSFAVHHAWTQAVHDPRGVFSMLTLGRSNGAVSPQELYEKAGDVLWLCHAMHAVLAQNVADNPSSSPLVTLTPREIQVLKWSGLGKTAEEVGSILSITPRTVSFHLNRAMQKLGVSSKIAAVLRASKAGLLD